MKTVDGRDAITRKEWAEEQDRSLAWARSVYDRRAETGHPEAAFTIGRTMYWWRDELYAWREQIRPAPIERIGDPDELLYAQGVADVLGYASYRTVQVMFNRNQFTEPDAIAPAADDGKPRRQWKRATVWDWADRRGWVRK